jgi:colanic acid/amylovoran biosynthesis glycosyltransferase
MKDGIAASSTSAAHDPEPSTANMLVFRSALLAYSETFIPAQAEQFRKFIPYYAGLIGVNGLKLPPERTITPAPSRLLGPMRDAAALFGWLDPGFFQNIRRVHPRLVHAHFEESGMKAMPIAERLNVPLVTTCHGYDVTVETYRWQRYPGLGAYYQRRRRDFFRRGKLFLGVSRFICDQMLRRGYPKEKVRLHHIGVDTGRLAPDPKIVRKPVVLLVGRLVEKKGCAYLIRAMGQVRLKFPEMELFIVGDGPLRTELEELARECRAGARFFGSQSAEFVRAALGEAFLLCTPSVRSRTGDSEGLPIVLLEAMAMATPVVATHHAGIPEAVEHNVTGLLCEERNPEALAQAIMALVADGNLRAQTRELETIYLELLG